MADPLLNFTASLSRRVYAFDVGDVSVIIPEAFPHRELSVLLADLCTGCRLRIGPDTASPALFSFSG